jgi:hypothetical protein
MTPEVVTSNFYEHQNNRNAKEVLAQVTLTHQRSFLKVADDNVADNITTKKLADDNVNGNVKTEDKRDKHQNTAHDKKTSFYLVLLW